MIKTIIVDDHKLFSEGVEKLLHGSGQFEIIAKFNDGRTLLNSIHNLPHDLLLIDIDMPEINGLDAIRRIRVNDKKLKIVVLSMHVETAFLHETKGLGANGYLTKSIDGNQLIESLVKVHQGDYVFPVFKPVESSLDIILSDREIEI